ncbi:MAG TPA: ParB/RepB/Spo0J family partition protein [Anaeromyxobacteraceae bacterium]|nr:ParB/RepB/Spo0J family partition protein [Anaeromyxobacteraceae bacterium]
MSTLPEATDPAAPPPTWSIPLDRLDPNPFQPRREMDEAKLAELVAGIREHGLLQPITVRRVPGGRFQVIGGHRRLEAYRRLLAETLGDEGARRYGAIPAHEKLDVTDELMALLSLVENLQRDDLSPLDAALGLLRFQEEHQLSAEALAKRTGLELDRVKRLLRLARAPKVVQDACHLGVMVEAGIADAPKRERGRLELMAALEFAKLHAHAMKTAPKKADERTARAIERALSERWSLRRIQSFCRAVLTGAEPELASSTAPAAATMPALFTDGTELRIRRAHLRAASAEERFALAGVLRTLLEELAA